MPVKVLLNGQLLAEGNGAAAARNWADRGLRRLASQWRGRDLPNPDVTVTAVQLRTVAELEKQHPELLRIVMKHQNRSEPDFHRQFSAGTGRPRPRDLRRDTSRS